MPLSPCADLLMEALNQVRAFLRSDLGRCFLASLAAVRAFAYCLSRSRLPQARELGAALLVAIVLAVLVAVSESQAPGLMVAGIKCNSLEAKKIAAEYPLRSGRRMPPG